MTIITLIWSGVSLSSLSLLYTQQPSGLLKLPGKLKFAPVVFCQSLKLSIPQHFNCNLNSTIKPDLTDLGVCLYLFLHLIPDRLVVFGALIVIRWLVIVLF